MLNNYIIDNGSEIQKNKISYLVLKQVIKKTQPLYQQIYYLLPETFRHQLLLLKDYSLQGIIVLLYKAMGQNCKPL